MRGVDCPDVWFVLMSPGDLGHAFWAGISQKQCPMGTSRRAAGDGPCPLLVMFSWALTGGGVARFSTEKLLCVSLSLISTLWGSA